MQTIFRKKGVIAIIAIIGIIFLLFIILNKKDKPIEKPTEVIIPKIEHSTIGTSVEGRKIEEYSYGNGSTRIMFVGGIHGGYEWNSILLSYQLMDYFEKNLDAIPKNVTVTVIPSINPDGLYKIISKDGRFTLSDVFTNTKSASGTGRFNSHDVDLNRNFDCKWKPESTWKGTTVSAGTKAFSEPEALALRDFVLKNKPKAAIFLHSQSNAVYASECKNGILPETIDIMNAYSFASGYSPVKTFDSYEITGDAEGWLSSINIPAITVELKTHESVEWDKNLAGVKAILKYYNK